MTTKTASIHRQPRSNLVELNIEIPSQEVDSAFGIAQQRLTARYRLLLDTMPEEERKDIADKKFSEEALAHEATQFLVEQSCEQTIRDERMRAMTQPQVTLDVLAQRGQAFKYTASFEEIPTLVLSSVDPVEISEENLLEEIQKIGTASQSVDELKDIMLEYLARKRLAERLIGETPAVLVQTQYENSLEELQGTLATQATSVAEYCRFQGISEQQLEKEIKAQAEETIRENLALEALFAALGFEVNDQEVQETLAILAQQNGVPDDMINLHLDDKKLTALAEMTMHRIATEWLLKHSIII